MTAKNLSALALGLAAFFASNEAQKTVGELFRKSPQALYLAAEYKLMRGDKEAALELLQMASARKRHSISSTTATSGDQRGRFSACPEAGSAVVTSLF